MKIKKKRENKVRGEKRSRRKINKLYNNLQNVKVELSRKAYYLLYFKVLLMKY